MTTSKAVLGGSLSLGALAPSTDYWMQIPAGTTATSPIKFTEGTAPTSVSNGYLFHDGLLGVDVHGNMRAYLPAVIWNKTDVTTIGNTSAEMSFLDSGSGRGSHIIPAGLLRAGSIIRLAGKGLLWTHGSGDTATLKIKSNTTAYVTSTLSLPNVSGAYAEFGADIRLDSIGAGGICSVIGRTVFGTSGGSAMTRVLTSTGNAIDTTTSNNIDITYQFSVARTDNVLQIYTGTLDLIY